jgi:LDH2 family malate/lactate/ureidoglycolate dehydrogenase
MATRAREEAAKAFARGVSLGDWPGKLTQGIGCISGSLLLVVDPFHFGLIDAVKGRSDRFARAVKSAKKRLGIEEIHLPGETGYRAWKAR